MCDMRVLLRSLSVRDLDKKQGSGRILGVDSDHKESASVAFALHAVGTSVASAAAFEDHSESKRAGVAFPAPHHRARAALIQGMRLLPCCVRDCLIQVVTQTNQVLSALCSW